MIKNVDELRNELRKFNPIIDDKCSQVLFDEENNYYNIVDIEEITDKKHWLYKENIRLVKKEARHLFKVLFIKLGYKSDFCPQDMPYDSALLDTTDGEIYSVRAIWKRRMAQA